MGCLPARHSTLHGLLLCVQVSSGSGRMPRTCRAPERVVRTSPPLRQNAVLFLDALPLAQMALAESCGNHNLSECALALDAEIDAMLLKWKLLPRSVWKVWMGVGKSGSAMRRLMVAFIPPLLLGGLGTSLQANLVP